MKKLTEIYPVHKTLTMELKPVGHTASIMDDAFANMDTSFVAMDKTRKEQYPKVKALIDEYYREVIKYILDTYSFEDICINELYKGYCTLQNEEDSDKKKTLYKKQQDLESKFCKGMSEYCGKVLVKFGLNKFSELFKADSEFMKWVGKQEDAENLRSILSLYDKNIGYFSKYKANRDFLFSGDGKQGSICARTLENIYIMFDNINRQLDIYKNHTPLAEILGINEESLYKQTEHFDMLKIFTPHDIATYNYETVAAYNQKINEYIQQSKITKNRPRLLKKLHKQILFETEKVFKVNVIKDKEELQEVINDGITQYNNALEYLNGMISYLTVELENVYLRTSHIRNLCNDTYKIEKAYNIFDNCLALYLESFSTKKSRELVESRMKKYVSLAEACSIIDDYSHEIEGYNGIHGKKLLEDYISYAKSLSEINNSIVISNENEKIPEETIMEIRDCLTEMNDNLAKYRHFVEPVNKGLDSSTGFYNMFESFMECVYSFSTAYNMIRNYLTKKNEAEPKRIPITFNINTLMSGMSSSKENTSHCFLLKKDGVYYLCIIPNGMTPKKLNITEAKEDEPFYEKMVYQMLKESYKALPKRYFSAQWQKTHEISPEIMDIKENKKYSKEADDIESARKLIDYYIRLLKSDAEWNEYYDFSSLTCGSDYDSYMDFCNAVDKCTTCMKFMRVSAEKIDMHVANGNLFMFQLYRKDFKKNVHGKKDMFTMYLDAAFSDGNVVTMNAPHITFDGGASICYLPSSKQVGVVHKKGVPIENKKAGGKKTSVFSYDIVKDKSHTVDKIVLNMPMTLNAHTQDIYVRDLNERVNAMMDNNEFDHMITITRSFRNLLYYRVTDFDGKVKEQGSFNVIDGTDYYSKIDAVAKERIEQKQSWKQVKPIKNIKDGYISLVISKIAEMVMKYNAIIILDRYNENEKNKKFALEKTLYKTFVDKLINKLSFLVLKDSPEDEAGSPLHPYQLAKPLGTMDTGNQSGIIYFMNPFDTDRMDIETGYTSRLYFKYKNRVAAKKEIDKFNYFMYDSRNGHFMFNLNYSKFGLKDEIKDEWSLYVHGTRHFYDNSAKSVTEKYKVVDLDLQLKNLFAKYEIDYTADQKMNMSVITENKDVDADFYKNLYFILNMAFKIRFVDYLNDEQDYAISPVLKDGAFFTTGAGTQYPCHDAVKTELLRQKLIAFKAGCDKDTWKTNLIRVEDNE